MKWPIDRCRCLLLGLGVIWTAMAAAQAQTAVRIGLFVPGNYLADNQHRLEVRNDGATPADVGQWLVVTRDYSVRLPRGLRLAPGQSYKLAKVSRPQYVPDLVLSRYPDFLIRLYSKKVEGNYAALLDRSGQLRDAFYHGQLPNVPFLPDAGEHVSPNQQRTAFSLPNESNPVWKYFRLGDDPAVGFEQTRSTWRPIAANPGRRLYARLAFGSFNGRFDGDAVTLQWSTTNEENLRQLEVLRGTDQRNMAPIGKVLARGKAQTTTAYTFYDADVQPNTTYYYLLRNVDRDEMVQYSKTLEVSTVAVPVEFWMDVYPRSSASGQDVGIRFYSAYSQPVRIRLLNARREVVGNLYQNLVYAETQNLLRLTKSLPPGRYLIEASVEKRRYFQQLTIGPE